MSVSVIIPAYNAASLISRAIDSVLSQTHSAAEIIVVDDGSTDDTQKIVAGYGDRVRLITQKNQGPSLARNLGVKNSTGVYIAFLDADDWWHPEKLEKQIAALKANPRAVLSYTSLLLVTMQGDESVHEAVDPEELATLLRIGNPMITPSCVAITREAFDRVGGFNSIRKGCEDWELWFRLRQLGPFCAVKDAVTVYLVSTAGLSADAQLVFEDFEKMLDRVLLSDVHGLSRFFWRKKIVSYQLYKAAMTARSAQDRFKEVNYMLRSISLWPSPFWHPKRFKALAATMMRKGYS